MNRWLALLPGVVLVTAAAAETTVRVTGVVPDGGPVRIAVFDDADGFPEPGAAAVTARVPATGSEVATALELPGAPRLAVAAYQDRDADGELDRNWLGVPTEPVGFSRGATIGFGPPSFDDAAVGVGKDIGILVVPLDGGEKEGGR
jgi:uncharacterized protein (DUF2141 family)